MKSSLINQTANRTISELNRDWRQHEQVAKVLKRNLDLLPEGSTQAQAIQREMITQQMKSQICMAGLLPEMLSDQQIKDLLKTTL